MALDVTLNEGRLVGVVTAGQLAAYNVGLLSSLSSNGIASGVVTVLCSP